MLLIIMVGKLIIIVNIVNKLSIVWNLFKQNGTPALKPSKRQTMDY